MGVYSPSGLPLNYNEKLQRLLQEKEAGGSSYRDILNDLFDMAKGGDADGRRKWYPPDWEDIHFQKLLEELMEDKE